MIKIYFRLKSLLLIFITPLVYILFVFIFLLAIYKQIIIGAIITLLIIFIITLGIVFGLMYGFKIDDKYIRIVSQQKIKKYEIESIKSINIIFTKINKYYSVEAKVRLINDDLPTIFSWDYIYTGKGCKLFYNITDKNIDNYIELLSKYKIFNIVVNK